MIKVLLLALQLSALGLGEGNTTSCLNSVQEDSASANVDGFYYAQFSGALVPVPVSLVVIPRASGDREFSLAFILENEPPFEAEAQKSGPPDSLGISSIWMSKGEAGLDKDRYQFESEELCVINGITVSHLKKSHSQIRIDELIYVNSPNGEKLLIGGSNLSQYKLLLIKALAR